MSRPGGGPRATPPSLESMRRRAIEAPSIRHLAVGELECSAAPRDDSCAAPADMLESMTGVTLEFIWFVYVFDYVSCDFMWDNPIECRLIQCEI